MQVLCPINVLHKFSAATTPTRDRKNDIWACDIRKWCQRFKAVLARGETCMRVVGYAKLFIGLGKLRSVSNSRITPLIFRVINQIRHAHSQGIISLTQLLQSGGPFVQHLIIDGCSDKEHLRTIVSPCPNVCNITVHLPLYKGVRWELGYFLLVLREMPQRLRWGISCKTGTK